MSEKIMKILSFYKFIKLENLKTLRKEIQKKLFIKNILGTVILSSEGININICGLKNDIDYTKAYLLKRLKINSVIVNEDEVNSVVFTKLKVKIKSEIVKSGFKLSYDNCSKEHVSPSEWDKLIASNTIIIDTRNKFEYLMGSFENAVHLDLFNFSDFENKITNYKMSDKQKKVAIYCTGGIRCEKASYILKKLGYKNIVQLEGGIINYIRQNPNSRKWRGKCFVFDDRITYEA